jgi:hypothetical protein
VLGEGTRQWEVGARDEHQGGGQGLERRLLGRRVVRARNENRRIVVVLPETHSGLV